MALPLMRVKALREVTRKRVHHACARAQCRHAIVRLAQALPSLNFGTLYTRVVRREWDLKACEKVPITKNQGFNCSFFLA